MTLPGAQPFPSILFPAGSSGGRPEEPACFRDLNLDQVVDAITAGREQYDLRPYFSAPLALAADVQFRQAVMADLDRPEVRACVDGFAGQMDELRTLLTMAARLRYPRQQDRLFLDAILCYSDAVLVLARELTLAGPRSPGLRAFRDSLDRYAGSRQFLALHDRARQLSDLLAAITYCLHIRGSRIRVTRYDGEADYALRLRDVFGALGPGGENVPPPPAPPAPRLEMDHVEAGILDLVASLHPAEFADLAGFCQGQPEFRDQGLIRFDREARFYLAYLDYLAPLRAAGLRFSYPQPGGTGTGSHATRAFDLALASKLTASGQPVVSNDFRLDGGQWLTVVTGPNQGGKTTFARAVGQLHYLASIGCLVPAEDTRLPLPGRVLTHFEREEDLGRLSGRLQDDLRRVREIVQQAAGGTVVILNEILTSTTPSDAARLSTQILEQIARTGATCVCVTFLDELAAPRPDTVSMVATVAPADPARRTFQIVPRPADGLAYADAIARKYGLTYETVKARVRS